MSETKKKTWRLINSGSMSGAMNMAIDDALLQSVAAGQSAPVLRLYRWQPATVTLGYAQSLSRDINREACHGAGLDIVRRQTGGRAVLHAHEVTYAVIAPVHGEAFAGSVLQSYQSIAEILRVTLNGLGINAQLVPGQRQGGTRDPIKAVCFTAPSQYELLVEQCKVAGSAQKRQGDAFLQHGSIPIEMNLELLDRILPCDSGVSAAQRFATVGWLNRWASNPLTIEAVEQALVATFADLLQVDWRHGGLSDAEQALAVTLCREKYGNPSWTEKKP